MADGRETNEITDGYFTHVAAEWNGTTQATPVYLPLAAAKLTEANAIDGVLFDGTAAVARFGVCGTAAGTAAKEVSVNGGSGFTLAAGAEVTVLFQYDNTAASARLNVNGTGAKYIRHRNAYLPSYTLKAGVAYKFAYDGTYWQLVGEADSAGILANGDDLDDFTHTGLWNTTGGQGGSSVAAGVANKPDGLSGGFMLDVRRLGPDGSTYMRQTLHAYNGGVWWRIYKANAWQAWEKWSVVPDAALSPSSGNAIQNMAVSEGFDIVPLLGNLFQLRNDYIHPSNVWTTSTTYKHWIVPVVGVSRIVVKANATIAAYYTFLKVYEDGGSSNVQGSEAYAYATGYSGRVSIAAGTEAVLEVPSDALWLYLYANSNERAKPQSVVIANRGLGLNAVDIAAGEDLDNCTNSGWYKCAADATVATLANSPTTNAFCMEVRKHTSNGCYQYLVEYLANGTAKRWFRNKYNTAWSAWKLCDTTYSAATQSAAGLMSAADKAKLDGIESGANAYTHPAYTGFTGEPSGNQAPAFGGTFQVTQIKVDATGHVSQHRERTVKIPDAAFTGANSEMAQDGTVGLVPKPYYGTQDDTKFLKGDGTWATPPGTYTLPVASANALGGVKTGYVQNGNKFGVRLSSQNAYVMVPLERNPSYMTVCGDGDNCILTGSLCAIASNGRMYSFITFGNDNSIVIDTQTKFPIGASVFYYSGSDDIDEQEQCEATYDFLSSGTVGIDERMSDEIGGVVDVSGFDPWGMELFVKVVVEADGTGFKLASGNLIYGKGNLEEGFYIHLGRTFSNDQFYLEEVNELYYLCYVGDEKTLVDYATYLASLKQDTLTAGRGIDATSLSSDTVAAKVISAGDYGVAKLGYSNALSLTGSDVYGVGKDQGTDKLCMDLSDVKYNDYARMSLQVGEFNVGQGALCAFATNGRLWPFTRTVGPGDKSSAGHATASDTFELPKFPIGAKVYCNVTPEGNLINKYVYPDTNPANPSAVLASRYAEVNGKLTDTHGSTFALASTKRVYLRVVVSDPYKTWTLPDVDGASPTSIIVDDTGLVDGNFYILLGDVVEGHTFTLEDNNTLYYKDANGLVEFSAWFVSTINNSVTYYMGKSDFKGVVVYDTQTGYEIVEETSGYGSSLLFKINATDAQSDAPLQYATMYARAKYGNDYSYAHHSEVSYGNKERFTARMMTNATFNAQTDDGVSGEVYRLHTGLYRISASFEVAAVDHNGTMISPGVDLTCSLMCLSRTSARWWSYNKDTEFNCKNEMLFDVPSNFNSIREVTITPDGMYRQVVFDGLYHVSEGDSDGFAYVLPFFHFKVGTKSGASGYVLVSYAQISMYRVGLTGLAVARSEQPTN